MSGDNDSLILALGNPLRGDDGFGAALLAYLQQNFALDGADFLDGGTAGLETTLLLQPYRRAMILDIAEMGLPAGEWRRLPIQGVELESGSINNSLHNAGLQEALALGQALGILPQEITLYCVQPRQIGWEPGLSREVERAIPAIADLIMEEMGRHQWQKAEF